MKILHLLGEPTPTPTLSISISLKVQNKLIIKANCQPGDQNNFLHLKSAQINSLMESTPCSHAPQLKNIATETSELAKHLKELKASIYKLSKSVPR